MIFGGYLLFASGYVLLAIRRLLAFKLPTNLSPKHFPPITILKPVHGAEVELFENLSSFCRQDYPEYQVVFGVATEDDPAVAVIRQVMAACPAADITLTVNGRAIGTNRKIGNVANCALLAKHDLFVIADSDMRVKPSYLQCVAASFDDPEVGAGTCLYRGRAPDGGLASMLGAAFINEWFLPSVLVALKFKSLHFCFGATMAVRRTILQEVGGFERLADELADDYMLGELVARCGKQVALIPYVVENTVQETSVGALIRHELRWARTIRTVQPVGFCLSFLTYVMPAAVAFALVTPSPARALLAIAVGIGLRALMHDAARIVHDIDAPAHYSLAVVRDLLCFGVWAMSFVTRDVEWQGYSFRVDKKGHLALKGTPQSP